MMLVSQQLNYKKKKKKKKKKRFYRDSNLDRWCESPESLPLDHGPPEKH